jgi:phosphate transport system protein
MSDKFHTEIDRTKEQVLSMGQLAEGMLKDAMEALRTGDLQMAAKVRERKRLLSDDTNRLEEEMYSLISLYQPVARDMRAIACSLRVISSSERIGVQERHRQRGDQHPGIPRFPRLVEGSLPHVGPGMADP